MSDFRARDSDRDRAVEVIGAAYAEGQLGDADRDLRIGRAQAAETLDEIAALTRDLRVSPTAYVASSPPSYGMARTTSRRPALPGRVVAGVAIAVVGLLGLGVASTLLATFSSTADRSPTSSQTISPAPEPVDAQAGAGFAMAPGKVREFLRSYEREFSTRKTYSVVLAGARVIVEVPVRGPRPHYARWLYDGSWRRLATTTPVLSPAGIVDLGALDVPRMFANIAKAERTLGVENGTLTHVVVHRWDDDVSTVNIYVANMFDESAYLATTLAGDRTVRRFPFRP